MIIGVVEHDRGKVNERSLQMLTLGRRLANELSVPLHAVLIGADGTVLAGELGRYGVSTVHIAQDDRLESYAPEAWAHSVVELVRALQSGAALAAGTDRGNEVMAHVAARLDLPMAANCTEASQAPQPGLVLARVGTLDNALTALADVRAWRTPPTC